MSQFLDSEAEESEDEELDEIDKKKSKRLKAMESDDDDDEDDEERIREELKDLIDDNPIEESDGSGDESDGSKKRKKSDDDFDDRLEEDDYDLIEENLGVKVERRKRFKRLRRLEDEESDDEGHGENPAEDREVIANQLFDTSDNEEDRGSDRAPSRAERVDNYNIEGDEEGEEYSDEDDDGFIVDDEGRPIKEKKKKRKHVYHDAALQEAQDIFGVDFDYDEFEKYDDEYEEDASDDDYLEDDEDGERRHRPKTQKRRKTTRKSIFEIYEPIELKRGHFTDLDNKIRNNDIPERMQLREVPVTPVPEGSDELEDEAEWIYKQAFCKPTLSTQENKGGADPRIQSKKGPQTIGKIKKALDFMRNQNFEVPFLAYYRKEYVEPELDIHALWRVYHFDGKWCQLKSRKTTLIELMEKMRNYQMEMLMVDTNAPIPDHIRIIKEEDIDKLRGVQTNEELKDIQGHFMLYYASDVPAMQENARKKAMERKKRDREMREEKRKLAMEAGEEVPEELEDTGDLDDEDANAETVKPASSSGPYTMCLKAGLAGFAKRFGLKPEHFAINVRDNYQRHEVDQESVDPYKLAGEYCIDLLKTADEVLKAGKYMVACQISREPLIRKCLRETFFDRAKINIVPTKAGMKEIDENHNCYSMKYVRRKPVRDLVKDDFLKLQIAEEDKLLTITFDEEVDGLGSLPYIEEVKQLYIRDEFSSNVQQWNDLRRECVDIAYRKLLMPEMVKELKRNLLAEAKEHVLKACKHKLSNWLSVASYKPEVDEDDDDWDTSKGIRVMGLAYSPDHEQASFACILSTDGEVLDHLRLPYIMKRPFNDDVKAKRDADFNHIRNFLLSKRPHLIVVGGESRDALWVVRDVKAVIDQLVIDEQFPQIQVEILDNHLAKIFANSIKGENEFRDYPQLLREAISLGRRMQDPLVEFSQLCTTDDEIICLRYHQFQEMLSQEELLEGLNQEFINRTNEVGVDINDVVQRVYAPNLLQFVCGLGPRKATALIKLMKQTNQRLENRTQLVTSCHMGPKIFINCAGFIKIDTNSLGDSTELYVEVLDGSRVHPETYEWARKMAVDALEYDDEEANPAGALEEILDAPERLKDLDLDAFAEELERQGFGNKSITLYDIRQELNHRYKDVRIPYKSPNAVQLFELLTKETQETFFVGKMILATVTGIARRKPQNDQLDKANPVRNDETGLWQCPFCFNNDFLELSDVWNHFDAGGCPGQASGIRIRLDNGISGFITMKNLSNTHVANPEDRVRFNQAIHCRVIKIEAERFSFEATSKSSDLKDEEHNWRPSKDPYYDHEMETRLKKVEIDKSKLKNAQTYIKRVIVHPCFHNVSFSEAVKLLHNSEQGDAIIRPSSKGADHLTVTWKVADNVYQHIDVQEKGKVNAFSLGRSLWIGREEFEDLDEIIARHITPMASNARELLRFRYYRDTDGGNIEKAEQILREERANNPSKIHYIVSVSQKYAGKFLLSCLPTRRSKHEYITVTPEGYRFRSQNFDSIASLFRWYKEHFRDATPHVTPMTARSSGQPYRPSPNMEPSPMNRSHSSHPNTTPQYSQSPHATYSNMHQSVYNTPYTPSGQTPYLGNYTTPRYGATQPPVHDGVFLHPSSLTPIVQSSPKPSSTPTRQPVQSADPNDWRRMAEEWAKAKQRGDGGYTTPNADGGGRHTPRSRYNNHRYSSGNRERAMSTPRSDAPSPTPSASSFGYQSPAPPPTSRGYKNSFNASSKSPRGPSSNVGTPYDPFTMDPGKDSPGVYASSSSRSGRHDEMTSDMRYASPGNRWTPRSGRSTPHTINSPRSMIESTMGDNTPLYDDS